MDEELKDEQLPEVLPEDEIPTGYVPRPAWQVWLARIGVVIMIICVILYYWHIANGGKI